MTSETYASATLRWKEAPIVARFTPARKAVVRHWTPAGRNGPVAGVLRHGVAIGGAVTVMKRRVRDYKIRTAEVCRAE